MKEIDSLTLSFEITFVKIGNLLIVYFEKIILNVKPKL